MKKFFRHIYVKQRFFIVLVAIIIAFLVSYMFPALYRTTRVLFYGMVLLLAVDYLILFVSKGKITASRILPDKLSNGDQNPIQITLSNGYLFQIQTRIIDEIPLQFQKRDFEINSPLKSGASGVFNYELRPTERGVYSFGSLNIYASSPIGFLARRYRFDDSAEIPVYPSFLQLQKYDLIAFTNRLHEYGLKKIRRIGHTMEFEQIKEYVQGDDIRNINWKATAKKSQLMVNQYQDEKSQPIYSVIDKGRVMKMPFEGLSLLDYAINATLVISNIAIKKQDKAGMFAFSNRIENRVVAERRNSQMNLILETLYNLRTNFVESDFSRLYIDIKRNLNQRSLLLLYTNFETLDALHRQLPYLQAIAKQHLLVVIFFENTELNLFAQKKAENIRQIFEQTIAEKFIYEKKLIVNELRQHGIQTMLTKPEDLTINTINKYLEIKARGLI
ncbi:DUF58 domain-containing protein [Flagellimonas allohymeniacidonis]|uniref:DUF58 domain-containing protein n=1 Tax=Flagellimonas allohymeniacidonis TaxID=2517819 RepID=A0A4Q8QGC2_9FLAO|nr:DUF58 domain-containing protein [Allomuricauda hymeniacidonis]TAI48268.1 DUF58 domain-containing protein [Allomuricauda hymeniacidonis]